MKTLPSCSTRSPLRSLRMRVKLSRIAVRGLRASIPTHLRNSTAPTLIPSLTLPWEYSSRVAACIASSAGLTV